MTTPGRGQTRVSGDELAAAAGITSSRLARLVELGLVEPIAAGMNVFTAAQAERLKRMLRLHEDLGVTLLGASIIVDLLERLTSLESELARLRRPRGLSPESPEDF